MPHVESAAREAFLILAILKRIPRSRKIDTNELRESLREAGFDIELRRLQRLLLDICKVDEFYVERDTRSKPYGYIRRVPDSELSTVKLRPQESLLIRLAEEHLKYQLPRPITRSMSELFEAAGTCLNERADRKKKAWLKKVAFVSGAVPMLPAKILQRIFDAVSEALYRDQKLRIKYVNNIDETREAVVSPLGLVQQEQRLYLVCQFDGYDDFRHLALHRLKLAEVMELEAVRPKDFDLDRYVAERHFNYSNGRKIRLTLEFTNSVTAKNLQETPFSKDQELKRLSDGAWRLEAIVDDTVILDGWIAAWREKAGIRLAQKTPIDEAEDD